MSKFLVLWHLDVARVGKETVSAIMSMPEYAKRLLDDKKLVCRYHIVGRHGGAWIYDVDSNEELERLLAQSPVYNVAHYEILPLAEMTDPKHVI